MTHFYFSLSLSSSSSCTNSIYSFDSFSPSIPINQTLLVGLLDGIQYLHRTGECKFLLVGQQWWVGFYRRSSNLKTQHMYIHWPPIILQTIQDEQDILGNAGELRTSVLLRNLHMDTPILADQQKNIHQLSADTGCCLEVLLSVMTDRDKWLGESRESMLSAQFDDDNDEFVFLLLWSFFNYHIALLVSFSHQL